VRELKKPSANSSLSERARWIVNAAMRSQKGWVRQEEERRVVPDFLTIVYNQEYGAQFCDEDPEDKRWYQGARSKTAHITSRRGS
jgi:hypothetical protein